MKIDRVIFSMWLSSVTVIKQATFVRVIILLRLFLWVIVEFLLLKHGHVWALRLILLIHHKLILILMSKLLHNAWLSLIIELISVHTVHIIVLIHAILLSKHIHAFLLVGHLTIDIRVSVHISIHIAIIVIIVIIVLHGIDHIKQRLLLLLSICLLIRPNLILLICLIHLHLQISVVLLLLVECFSLAIHVCLLHTVHLLSWYFAFIQHPICLLIIRHLSISSEWVVL